MEHSTHECCTVDWTEARHAAEHLLKSVYRVDLRKALNPLDDDDFLVIVQQLSDQLRKIAGPVEQAAVQRALNILDVDLTNLTGPEAAQLARAANLAMRGIPQQILPEIVGTVKGDLTETVGQTKIRAAKTWNWAIATSLDAVDERMVNAVGNIGSWVTDEFGKRAAMFEHGVQRVIADGMSEGLRNESIAKKLHELANGQINQSKKYWNTVSTNLTNRARGFGHLRSMEAAGVENYQFYAIMDERTTVECRALHETVFPVSTGLKAYEDLEVQGASDINAIERVMPFVKTRALGDGVTEMFVAPPGLGTTVIGQVTRSAVGQADVRGTFQNMLSPSQLAAAGISVPPLHHLCRSTIIPVI